MTTFNVGVDLGNLLRGSPINKESFPALSFAIRQLAEHGLGIWSGYASGQPLPGGGSIQVKTGRYLRSIKSRSINDFEAEIYSDVPYATAIEHGWPVRDLKKMLNTSLKVRRSKKTGKRYLIIPFRHGTPGAVSMRNTMPKDVHDIVKSKVFEASRITGHTTRKSGQINKQHISVRQRLYKWGGRLTGTQLSSAGVHGVKKRHMTGMVKMQNPTGSGGGKHTQYLTFRVMSEDSSGWITKAKPGYYPARTTSEQLQKIANKTFALAAQADINFFSKMVIK